MLFLCPVPELPSQGILLVSESGIITGKLYESYTLNY